MKLWPSWTSYLIILIKKMLSLVKFVLSSVTLSVEVVLLKRYGQLNGFAAVINLVKIWETKTLLYSIDFVIKILVMIQFFYAAKLFNSLSCRFFSVHHFASETFSKNWQQEILKLDNFKKNSLRSGVRFFGGFKFVGVLFEIFLSKTFSRGAPFDFLPKLLPGETLCKLCQIFPPKDLVYIGRKILVTPLIS